MNKVFIFLWLVGGGIEGPFEYETSTECHVLLVSYEERLRQYGGGSIEFDCEPIELEKEME